MEGRGRRGGREGRRDSSRGRGRREERMNKESEFTQIHLVFQTWIKHYKKLLAITHIPSLHLVYVGVEDGSIMAFSEDLPSHPLISLDPLLTKPPLVSLTPIAQYRDSTQSCSCILAIPLTKQSNQCSGGNQEQQYELWVGQKGNMITVLDAASLRVVKFLLNRLDQSVMPTFVAHLSCSHLVYGSTKGVAKGEGSQGTCDHLSVYSALYHGQYVTRWSVEQKKPMDCFDCRPHATGVEGQLCYFTDSAGDPLLLF
jgi:hypothetical protein